MEAGARNAGWAGQGLTARRAGQRRLICVGRRVGGTLRRKINDLRQENAGSYGNSDIICLPPGRCWPTKAMTPTGSVRRLRTGGSQLASRPGVGAETLPVTTASSTGSHRIENLFARLKDWRRIATRYDRCGELFLSAICIAATVMFCL